MVPCPSCRSEMTHAHNATLTVDGHPDARTARFIANALERDPSLEGAVYGVYESPCCCCGCRRYLPTARTVHA